jgi:hypothetical protein
LSFYNQRPFDSRIGFTDFATVTVASSSCTPPLSNFIEGRERGQPLLHNNFLIGLVFSISSILGLLTITGVGGRWVEPGVQKRDQDYHEQEAKTKTPRSRGQH